MNEEELFKKLEKELWEMRWEMWVEENVKNPTYFTPDYQTPFKRGYRGSYVKHTNRSKRAHNLYK